jgi:hypothetical protein
MTDQTKPTDEPAAPLHPLVIRRLRVERWRRREAEQKSDQWEAVVAVMCLARAMRDGLPESRDLTRVVTLEKARSVRWKRELMNDLSKGRKAIADLQAESRRREAVETELRAVTRDRDCIAREAAEAAKRAKEVIQRQGQKLVDGAGFHDGLVLLEMARVLLSGAEPPSEEWRQTAVDWFRAYDRAVQVTAGTVAGITQPGSRGGGRAARQAARGQPPLACIRELSDVDI